MILQVLADYTCSLRLESLDQEHIKWAQLCLLDSIECCFDTFNDLRVQVALKVALEEKGGCTLFGRNEKSSVRGATFYNIVSGSVSSRNDMNIEGNAHPGASIVPLVVALGEANAVSGKTVLEAIIVGYEILKRFGMTIGLDGSGKIPASLRKTSLGIALASSFAASKILGLNGVMTAKAAAMSCHYISGLNEWRMEGTGEDVFLNAYAALYGLSCVTLVKAGADVTLGNFEGDFGLLNVFGARGNSHLMTMDLEHFNAIIETKHKQIKACRALQSLCLTAEKIVADVRFDLNKIKKISLIVSSQLQDSPWYFRKNDVCNLVQASMSMPFGLVATLSSGACTDIQWMPPYDDRVRSLMDMIEIVFTEKKMRDAVEIDVMLDDGMHIIATADQFYSLSAEGIESNFLKHMPGYIGMENTRQVLDLCSELSCCQNFSQMLDYLSVKKEEMNE